MAQFWTDFSEYDLGDITSQGWTGWFNAVLSTTEIVSDAEAGKVLRFYRNDSGSRKALTWDEASSDSGSEDFEVVTRMRIYTDGSGVLSGVAGRISGDVTEESLYTGLLGPSGTSLEIYEYTAGSGVQLASDVISEIPHQTWFYLRFRVETDGSDARLKLKIWIGDVGDEPGSWGIDITDTSPRSDGAIGVWSFRRGAEYDWIGIGTGGDPAPTGPDDPGEEASGSGHQTTYAAGSAAQVQPATGGGYQLSAASGRAVQAQPATGSGHQSSYGAGAAEGEVLSPASGAGHQVGYATGQAAQLQPASGSGYQASYGIGTAEAAALPSDASGSGYQLSYGTGAATQAQPARGEGYQRTYGAGAAAQAQPASGSGYQQSYGLGSAFTVKAARGSGYQISYARHVVRREDSERPAGGYSYAILNEYDAERQRREAARRARARLKEQAREIEDAVTREIAEHLHAQEEELARQAELDRISALARRHAQAVSEAHEGERVVRAVTRAAIQGNFSALEALERELERLREEEMFLFECLAMVAEYEHAA